MVKSNAQKLQKKAESAKVSELPVHSFMTRDVITLVKGTKIYSAVKSLSINRISGAPVVDASGRLVGLVTEYDLLMQVATRDVAEPFTYNEKVLTVLPDQTLGEVLVTLYKTKYRRLPVVNELKQVVGIVSRIDVLKKLVNL
ncbi:MAG: CBS domain-containing protein [Bdellovibrio sp.]|nr:MAG: CBS domain-containing protein [Bdellovibrio sp.]